MGAPSENCAELRSELRNNCAAGAGELRAAHPSKLSRLRFGRQSPQSLSSGSFCQRPIAGSVRCSSKIDLSHDTDFIVDAVGRIDVWPSAPGTSTATASRTSRTRGPLL